MARVVKQQEERQAEILEAARELFFAQGYEVTSVQQIIDRVGISKGAFYHHFASKELLLDRLVTRMATRVVQEHVSGSRGAALRRLDAFYRRGWSFKQDNLAMTLELLRVMYAPQNLRLRLRLAEATRDVVAPVLADIIRQGIREGVFDCTEPEWTAALVLQIGTLVNDFLAEQLLDDSDVVREARVQRMEARLRLYEDAVERLLGAPRGSIHMVEPGAPARIVDAARRGQA